MAESKKKAGVAEENVATLRALTTGELEEKLLQKRRDLAKLRLARRLGKLSDTSQVGKRRGEIARLLTILAEKVFLSKE